MLVLGIETSTVRTSVAIASANEVVASYQLAGGLTNDQATISAIERLLDDASLEYRELYGIAVGLGPGLFTGLRVGVATAKALAGALSIPIIGVSSLDVLAYNVRLSKRLICTCVDARRREVYWALYRPVPTGVQRITEFRCGPAEHCRNEIEAKGATVLVVGNGAIANQEIFDGIEVASVGDSTPTAVSLVELAIRRFEREDHDSINDLRPLYVRRTDAEIKLAGTLGTNA